MLVVICAIRKFMECVFSRRELRALDDLLPESGSGSGGRTRRHGGSIFNKIGGGGGNESDEENEAERKRQADAEAEKQALMHSQARAK